MRRLGRVLLALGAIALTAAAADRAFPPDLSRYRERSLEILDRDGRPLRLFTTGDGMVRLATTPDAVDPRCLALLLDVEDRRFWRHPGVDPLALARAGWQFASSGHVVSGGSTLTMQVARLLEPHRHDVAGKLFDMARALQLEARLSKHEILSIYLTLAPMGGNLEGVRAASRVYFDREPAELLPAQAALLVAIPQNPTRLRPDRRPAAAERALRRLLPRIESAVSIDAPGPSLTIEPRPLPMHALHLADRLRARGRAGAVRTTIDGALQEAVEALATRERGWIAAEANVAIMAVANRERSVLAYLGGVDYFGRAGMVDMMRAARSPGSALKPFVYGMAFDGGIATPDTIIDDEPMALGDYQPRNFDRIFHGAVTAREALQQSYNLPAVQLLAAVGAGQFAVTLRSAGVRLAFPHDAWSPGLPMVLGGVGVSLGDLAMLYAALANGGRPAPLRVEADLRLAVAAPLMTETAAWQVGDILRGVVPPDGVAARRPRAIAYKTGTSYGFRDALALGFSSDYTVAVWVGRTEGTPRPGFYGRNTAAPLLFQVFDLLPPESMGGPPPLGIAAAAGSGSVRMPRRLASQDAAQAIVARGASALRIIFPPAGARIDLGHRTGEAASLPLEAAGGSPPYRWAVNGAPMPSPATGASASWRPDGPGFATVAVTDSLERTTVADFRLD
jgi:penicillin-binding protein 1C